MAECLISLLKYNIILRLFVCLLNLGFTSNKLIFFPWRNGEDAGIVIQGSVVRAPAQEIFHSNSGLLSFNKPETVLWTIAKILLLYNIILC